MIAYLTKVWSRSSAARFRVAQFRGAELSNATDEKDMYKEQARLVN